MTMTLAKHTHVEVVTPVVSLFLNYKNFGELSCHINGIFNASFALLEENIQN